MLVFPVLFFGGIYYFIKGRKVPYGKIISSPSVIIVSLILGFFIQANSALQRESSHSYPETVVDSYTETCIKSEKAKPDGRNQNAFCSCSISEIQRVYTYGEFKNIVEEFEKDNSSTPSEFKNIITECTKKSRT